MWKRNCGHPLVFFMLNVCTHVWCQAAICVYVCVLRVFFFPFSDLSSHIIHLKLTQSFLCPSGSHRPHLQNTQIPLVAHSLCHNQYERLCLQNGRKRKTENRWHWNEQGWCILGLFKNTLCKTSTLRIQWPIIWTFKNLLGSASVLDTASVFYQHFLNIYHWRGDTASDTRTYFLGAVW